MGILRGAALWVLSQALVVLFVRRSTNRRGPASTIAQTRDELSSRAKAGDGVAIAGVVTDCGRLKGFAWVAGSATKDESGAVAVDIQYGWTWRAATAEAYAKARGFDAMSTFRESQRTALDADLKPANRQDRAIWN